MNNGNDYVKQNPDFENDQIGGLKLLPLIQALRSEGHAETATHLEHLYTELSLTVDSAFKKLLKAQYWKHAAKTDGDPGPIPDFLNDS